MPTGIEDGYHYTLALRPGALLDGAYRVTNVLGSLSAFAITYLAQDERGGDSVVVKEFLPRTLVGRAADQLTVRPHSPHDATSFARALRRLVREAELLGDIAHPNLPRVRRYFEANGTAYLVMQHYEGKLLTEHAAAAGGRLAVDRALGLMLQVLQGLEALHAEGIIHGYITPDTILVDENARALLLGLGTTCQVVGYAKEPAAGFAPIEQYASREVGPWTDVYASAAVLYFLITGETPPSAVQRSAGQSIPLAWSAAANVSPSLARTVLGALAQLPDARPHSAQEFRRRLEASVALGSQPMGPRIEPRAPAARRPMTDEAEPLPAAIPLAPPAAPEPEPEPVRLDEPAYFSTTALPGDRVRRLLRLVLGAGGAAAAILVGVSIVGGGGEDDWSGGVVSASPAPVANAQTPPLTATVNHAAAPISRPAPALDAGADRRGAPEPLVRQAANESARTAILRAPEPAALRPPQPPQKMAAQNGSPRGAVDAATSLSVPAPRPVSLSLPTNAGRLEVMPVEVLAGLRERLTHGKEEAEIGEYASARRILKAGLEQLAKLSDRYGATQTFSAVKRDFEQAAERAAASCKAENDIVRKRNGRPIQCE